MLPVDFIGANQDMNKPEDMTAEQCGNLRVLALRTHRGNEYTSCWKPAWEDVKNLEVGSAVIIKMWLGKPIYVHVSTTLNICPPVAAYQDAVVWVPGLQDMTRIKTGSPIYITFLTDTFPVMEVLVNEK